MTTLVAMLIVSVFTIDYFALKLEVLSRFFTLVPDLIGLIIALAIIARLLVLHSWRQSLAYVWLFGAFIAICLIGLVAESVSPGVVVAGIRNYFKFMPLLFLPAVYHFTPDQKRLLVGTFLLMAFIQVPLAFYQRFVQFAHRMHTGDPVTGTVSTSSSLTLVLCVAIALVITLYLHRRISLLVTLVLFACLAAPTAINETKATIFLLPVATLMPFVLAFGVRDKWRRLIPVAALCAAGIVLFGITYNILSEHRWWEQRNIFEFFTSAEFSGYLYRGAEVDGGDQLVGRFDSIVLPVQVLSDNWMQLLFGVGIGNASPSFIDELTGAFADEAAQYGFNKTAIANLLWEVGILGLLFYLVLLFFIYRDARRWARSGHGDAWLGTWWSVAILILVPALLYKPILIFNETSAMLFFWSGTCAAEAWRARKTAGNVDAAEGARPKIKLAGRDADRTESLLDSPALRT